MDIATFIGIIFFTGFVALAIYLAEGMAGFIPFLNIEAALMVGGGTFCALLISYPLSEVLGTFKILKKVMSSKGGEDTSRLVSTFVSLTKKAKTDGFLSLEPELKNIDNDFLKRGVQLVVDGADHEFIRNMLETELDFIRERHKVGRGIFNALGTYAPAFGIIGTVLAMILMLNSIEDVAQVPKKMALALAAAFYGMGLGYWLFLPMAGKLKRRSEEEIFVKEIIIRGILLLQSGATPGTVAANLRAYLEPSKRTEVDDKQTSAAEETPTPAE